MRIRVVGFVLVSFFAVALIGCSSKSSSPNSTSTDNSAASSTQTAQNNQPNAPAAAADNTPQAQPIVVPAGTSLTIRLGQAVGSKVSQAGQSFSGTLAQSVQVKGQTVIPKGSAITGRVVDAQPLGRFKGGARLELKLTAVDINGNTQTVQTASIVQVLKGKGKRTAVLAGGGAGLGAVMGGIFGGGKGAAVGALAGGGAGTAGAAYTGNKEIEFPAESALTFKLTKSFQL